MGLVEPDGESRAQRVSVRTHVAHGSLERRWVNVMADTPSTSPSSSDGGGAG
jgi:hypothetical protein